MAPQHLFNSHYAQMQMHIPYFFVAETLKNAVVPFDAEERSLLDVRLMCYIIFPKLTKHILAFFDEMPSTVLKCTFHLQI